MAGQTIQVSVLADTKKFKRAMTELGQTTGLDKLGGAIKGLGAGLAVATGAVAAGAGAIAAKSVEAASSLQQSMGAVESVFKETTEQVNAYARDAANNVGLSKNSYNELAAIIGTTLKAAGTPMGELAGQTDVLLTRSADLAATFGGEVTQASAAMASALRGEFEPLRAYGVSLSAAAIEARALADTGKANAKELTAQEKALATQALILDSSADSAGAFARESNTLAGQQERLKAKLENISATIGTALLPMLTSAVTWVSDRLGPAFDTARTYATQLGEAFTTNVLPKLRELGDWITTNVVPALQAFGDYVTGTVVPALQSAAQWVQENRTWLEPLALVIATMVTAYRGYVAVMATYHAVVNVVKAAQLALNAAQAANPIGLLVMAIAGLIAALVYLWNTNDGFREAVTTAWEKVKAAVAGVGEWFTKTVPAWWDQVQADTRRVWGAITDFFTVTVPSAVKGAFQGVWDFIKTVWNWSPYGLIVNNWSTIMEFFGSIPGKVKGLFTGAGDWLKDAGKDAINGLIEGAGGLLSKLGQFFLDKVPAFIKEPFKAALGIKSPSRWFAARATDSARGYTEQMTREGARLARASQGMADVVARNFNPELDAGALQAVTARRGQVVNHVRVEVSTLTGGPEAGRAVRDALDEFYALNGGDR